MVKKSSSRYARALVELVLEEKVSEKVRSELQEFKKLLEDSKELKELLFKKVFSGQEKTTVLKSVLEKLSLSDLTQKFLLYLAKQNRAHLFFDIMQEFEQKMDEHTGISKAYVLTAVPLSKPLQKKVEERFESWMGKKLEVTYDVNPSLIGGIVAKVGHHILDGSVLTQLHDLKNQLEQGV